MKKIYKAPALSQCKMKFCAILAGSERHPSHSNNVIPNGSSNDEPDANTGGCAKNVWSLWDE